MASLYRKGIVIEDVTVKSLFDNRNHRSTSYIINRDVWSSDIDSIYDYFIRYMPVRITVHWKNGVIGMKNGCCVFHSGHYNQLFERLIQKLSYGKLSIYIALVDEYECDDLSWFHILSTRFSFSKLYISSDRTDDLINSRILDKVPSLVVF